MLAECMWEISVSRKKKLGEGGEGGKSRGEEGRGGEEKGEGEGVGDCAQNGILFCLFICYKDTLNMSHNSQSNKKK